MIITLTDTTTAKISSALLRARRNAGSPAMGMVLTLLVVCDEKEYESALQAAMESGREHPARILLIVTASGRVASLDAEVRIGEGTPGEVVVIRMRGPLASHPASVVRPLLLPDSPVVIWWPGRAPANIAADELAGLAGRRVTDAAAAKRPLVELKTRAATYEPGDTDLAWTRLTRWRALLAASLDQYPARVGGVIVEAERSNPSADLLAAWLESRLRVKVARKVTTGPGITAVRLSTAAGDIAITRSDGLLASYAVPGQPERLVALKRRETTELITEELRRMDADDVYAYALKALQRFSGNGSNAGAAEARMAATKAAATPTAKTTAAKKSAAKKSATTKAAATKKAGTSRSAARKSVAQRSVAQKSATQKSVAKKSVAKKSVAKKSVAKAAAKKAAEPNAPAKKATRKRSPAKAPAEQVG